MRTGMLRASLQSPLHLASRHTPGNHASTLHYIPGSAIRGALAMAYRHPEQEALRQHIQRKLEPYQKDVDEYFDWLFMSGSVRFPNLYPAPFVLPLSARSCKRFPGFAELDQGHGVCDILLHEPLHHRCTDQITFRQKRYNCQAPMEPLQGFYRYRGSGGTNLSNASRVTPPRRIITRTAIENPTGTVQQTALYSLEVLEEGTNDYTGDLQIDPPSGWEPIAAQVAQELLIEHLSQHSVSEDHQSAGVQAGALTRIAVGAARTRGLGAVTLELQEGYSALAPLPTLKDRLDQFQVVWNRARSAQPGVLAFTLTLNSDAILLDPLWRYVSVLAPAMLPEGLPCSLDPTHFTATRTVSGWNSAQRLPKEDELAIVQGASFLYTTTADRATLLDWLERIEAQGIGDRRAEGFGQVIACHPFHWEVPQP